MNLKQFEQSLTENEKQQFGDTAPLVFEKVDTKIPLDCMNLPKII